MEQEAISYVKGNKMNAKIKTLLVLISFAMSISPAVGLDQIIEVTDAARSWAVHDGHPLYYTSTDGSHYQVVNRTVSPLAIYSRHGVISLSPSADYRLLTRLQDKAEVKDGQRYSDYFVMDNTDQLIFKVTRGVAADLKPAIAAISDQGVLALADPVQSHIYFYELGTLIAEGQLYEADFSLERKIKLQWVGERCYILLERPGFNGAPPDEVLFIGINGDGRGQMTAVLPFSYLQQFIFQDQRFFISGYNYSAEEQKMNPLIVEVSPQGQVLWTNENFGHELAISANSNYLAALSSHEDVQLFDLKLERTQVIHYDHDNKVSLGLAINDLGETAVIRVPVDFFVKRNTHFAKIYFPTTKQSQAIQIDPRFPKLFQLYSDGQRFFIGTNFEWLEIR